MKRIGTKQNQESNLNRRLELVRTTIRELTPTQLGQINGGTEATKDETNPDPEPWCPPLYTDSE
jgi:hypothetical protein